MEQFNNLLVIWDMKRACTFKDYYFTVCQTGSNWHKLIVTPGLLEKDQVLEVQTIFSSWHHHFDLTVNCLSTLLYLLCPLFVIHCLAWCVIVCQPLMGLPCRAWQPKCLFFSMFHGSSMRSQPAGRWLLKDYWVFHALLASSFFCVRS